MAHPAATPNLPPASDDYAFFYDPAAKNESGDTTFVCDHLPTDLEDRLEAEAEARRAASAFEHH